MSLRELLDGTEIPWPVIGEPLRGALRGFTGRIKACSGTGLFYETVVFVAWARRHDNVFERE